MNETKPHIRFTLGKAERLCSEKIITGLFQPGFFVSKYPLRVNVSFTELPDPGVTAQVLFSVSKKRFKKATDRNRVKRLLREVYRLNKHRLLQALEEKQLTAALAIIYTGKQLPEFQELQQIFHTATEKIIRHIHAQ